MTKHEGLIFEVPDYIEDDEFEEYFIENFDELKPALDLEVEDDRALVDDVEIEVFQLYEERVDIQYIVKYSAYFGCSDMDYSNEDQRVISGKRIGRQFLFEIFVAPAKRSTYEEF